MNKNNLPLNSVSISEGDLSSEVLVLAKTKGLVAWDIETSGLNWEKNQIGTCQIYLPDTRVYIVSVTHHYPSNLINLLSDRNVCKIFHHAIFDLRFMIYKWMVEPKNIVCTKIASKILDPFKEKHGLKNILWDYTRVEIDKSQQLSNWVSPHLSQDQIAYAVNDVIHLPRLFDVLKTKLESNGRWPLASDSFTYLPTRAVLDILGTSDVFLY
ncbi:MAG: hypothetical protein GFH27_549293n153 [Chloroflexi bacterium AL-W]|nr:hypothetical protein [Chloroflexi bacterium AL-N1]NOK67732.1 hypothetical protein [Chloroflexi bacterium AL-N10]NOK75498.1 hypothetical protein [Chloroflexi bacterium AL-N5]NOK82286.1 hypothetical protein [Chloroflexi bacterium AL-W]NOK90131.1 hypothetical protein [Chloroflexi bacterium AL-N15]